MVGHAASGRGHARVRKGEKLSSEEREPARGPIAARPRSISSCRSTSCSPLPSRHSIARRQIAIRRASNRFPHASSTPRMGFVLRGSTCIRETICALEPAGLQNASRFACTRSRMSCAAFASAPEAKERERARKPRERAIHGTARQAPRVGTHDPAHREGDKSARTAGRGGDIADSQAVYPFNVKWEAAPPKAPTCNLRPSLGPQAGAPVLRRVGAPDLCEARGARASVPRLPGISACPLARRPLHVSTSKTSGAG